MRPGHRVLIGTLEGDWEGLRPHLALRDVRILNAAGEPAIALDRVENTLSWLSLLHWSRGSTRYASTSLIFPCAAMRQERSRSPGSP